MAKTTKPRKLTRALPKRLPKAALAAREAVASLKVPVPLGVASPSPVAASPVTPSTQPLWQNSSMASGNSGPSGDGPSGDGPSGVPAPGSAVVATVDAPTSAAPAFAGLTTAVDIASRQAKAEAEAAAVLRRSGVEALTLRVALEDAAEALTGIPADLTSGEVVSWRDVFLKGDRLRGLGVLLVVACIVWLALPA